MKDKEPLGPLTLKNHRHSMVRKKLAEHSIESVLDVGGKSYNRDNQGRLTFNPDTAELLGLGNHVYFSVNIAGDYDQSRYPDVIYNGSSLPFRSNSITAVTAIDVLEHIPNKDKGNFIFEACRVASKRAFFVFPFDSKNNRVFEDRLAAKLEIHGIPHRSSFSEHRQLGLPKIAEVQLVLKALGYSYEILYHSPLEILMPYHDQQIELLATYRQGVMDKETTQRLLLELQTNTEDMLDHYTKEVPSDGAYRVLFDVETNVSL